MTDEAKVKEIYPDAHESYDGATYWVWQSREIPKTCLGAGGNAPFAWRQAFRQLPKLPEQTPPTETQEKFPASTCVECGRRIPAGQMQKCHETPGGYCSHRIPAALRGWIEAQPVAAPTERVEMSPDPDQLMRFINHLCGGSAQGFIAFAKWRNGQKKLARHIAAVAPSPAGESQTLQFHAALTVLAEMVTDEAFVELCQSIGEEPNWLKRARLVLKEAEATNV